MLLGAFREQDTDGSGKLGIEEFMRALRTLNLDLNDSDMIAVFNRLDADGSGVLELKEFINEIRAEADPKDAQWMRLGIGHQYIQPNREPPSTKGVRSGPWASGFNRGNRVQATRVPPRPALKPAASAGQLVSVGSLGGSARHGRADAAWRPRAVCAAARGARGPRTAAGALARTLASSVAGRWAAGAGELERADGAAAAQGLLLATKDVGASQPLQGVRRRRVGPAGAG